MIGFDILVPIGFMAALGLLYGGTLALSKIWFARSHSDELVDYIDNLLPQMQCAQCGFPGCRPYAEAVAGGEATDLCPPGGENVALKLAELMGRDPSTPSRVMSTTSIVRIVEEDCVGCARCIKVCPVDAIVGAELQMHTVLEKFCTGCELCIPECPVDCIDLICEEDEPQAA